MYCYLVNRSWHTAVCAVQTKPFTAASYSYVPLFTTLMFPSIKSQSQYTRIFYMPFSYSLSMCTFHSIQHSIPYSIAKKQTASQMLACSEIM